MLLVGRALPQIEERLSRSADGAPPTATRLLIYSCLLARYGQLGLLERLRNKVGRPDGLPGLWLLAPGDQHALLEGQAIPILSPGQRARPRSLAGKPSPRKLL